MLVETKARVGVFAVALGAYLKQFSTLEQEFLSQFEAFKKGLPASVEIIDGGLVTTKEKAMEAGDKFRAADVDIVFCQMLTYATSYNLLPAVRDLNVPVILVNIQKKKRPITRIRISQPGLASSMLAAAWAKRSRICSAPTSVMPSSSPASSKAAIRKWRRSSSIGAKPRRSAVVFVTPTSLKSAAPTLA